ncbi:MAG: hypothetical protein VKK94_04645 [Cyanobacteriota bacterium]|nr:hypothetical protein [Cyanobacteriota bacterium]
MEFSEEISEEINVRPFPLQRLQLPFPAWIAWLQVETAAIRPWLLSIPIALLTVFMAPGR